MLQRKVLSVHIYMCERKCIIESCEAENKKEKDGEKLVKRGKKKKNITKRNKEGYSHSWSSLGK